MWIWVWCTELGNEHLQTTTLNLSLKSPQTCCSYICHAQLNTNELFCHPNQTLPSLPIYLCYEYSLSYLYMPTNSSCPQSGQSCAKLPPPQNPPSSPFCISQCHCMTLVTMPQFESFDSYQSLLNVEQLNAHTVWPPIPHPYSTLLTSCFTFTPLGLVTLRYFQLLMHLPSPAVIPPFSPFFISYYLVQELMLPHNIPCHAHFNSSQSLLNTHTIRPTIPSIH